MSTTQSLFPFLATSDVCWHTIQLLFQAFGVHFFPLWARSTLVAGLLANETSDSFRLAVVVTGHTSITQLAMLVYVFHTHLTVVTVPVKTTIFRCAVIAKVTVPVVTRHPTVALDTKHVVVLWKRDLVPRNVRKDSHGRTFGPFARGSVECLVVLVADCVVEHLQTGHRRSDALLVKVWEKPEYVGLATP